MYLYGAMFDGPISKSCFLKNQTTFWNIYLFYLLFMYSEFIFWYFESHKMKPLLTLMQEASRLGSRSDKNNQPNNFHVQRNLDTSTRNKPGCTREHLIYVELVGVRMNGKTSLRVILHITWGDYGHQTSPLHAALCWVRTWSRETRLMKFMGRRYLASLLVPESPYRSHGARLCARWDRRLLCGCYE